MQFRKIKLNGREMWIEDGLTGDGVVCLDLNEVRRGEISYAHAYVEEDVILRWQKPIGKVSEIEYLDETAEAEPFEDDDGSAFEQAANDVFTAMLGGDPFVGRRPEEEDE